MEILANEHGKSIFRRTKPFGFWGKNAWVRKYKDFNPGVGELFPLSTTLLVFLTDGYHFSQWMMFTCLSLAVVFFDPMLITGLDSIIAIFFIYRISWSLLFWLFHGTVLRI